MAEQTPTIAVLLGAGASAEAGIPMTVGMIDAVVDSIAHDPDQLHLLQFIRRTLEADAESRRVDGPLDVERLFAAVDLLIGRNEQPWSPFVGSWSRGLESFGVRSSRAQSSFPPSEFREVGSAIENAIRGRSVSYGVLDRRVGDQLHTRPLAPRRVLHWRQQNNLRSLFAAE